MAEKIKTKEEITEETRKTEEAVEENKRRAEEYFASLKSQKAGTETQASAVLETKTDPEPKPEEKTENPEEKRKQAVAKFLGYFRWYLKEGIKGIKKGDKTEAKDKRAKELSATLEETDQILGKKGEELNLETGINFINELITERAGDEHARFFA